MYNSGPTHGDQCSDHRHRRDNGEWGKQQSNVETVITLVESIMDQTEAFDTSKVIDRALELSRKYKITAVDTRPSRRVQNLPTKLQGTFVTGSLGHNSAATVEDLDVRPL